MGELTIYCAGLEDKALLVGPIEAILLSAPNLDKNTKELLQTLNIRTWMMDSGGYQLHVSEINGRTITSDPFQPMFVSPEKGVNITPEHVLSVAAEYRPSWIIGLDFPIRKLSDHGEMQTEFEKKLITNVEWAITMSELLPEYGLDHRRLLLPVQCYDLDQFEIFYSLINGLRFGGMSMPVRNMDAKLTIDFLENMFGRQIRRVHLLGTTSSEFIALSAYLVRHFFDCISLDSTTWFKNALNGWYMKPSDLKTRNVRRGANYSGNEAAINCGCPWCSYESSLNEIKDKNYAEKMEFLCQHNFWVIRNFADRAFEAAVDLQTFESFLEGRFQDQDGQQVKDVLIRSLRSFQSR
jgi:hypothetical protein